MTEIVWPIVVCFVASLAAGVKVYLHGRSLEAQTLAVTNSVKKLSDALAERIQCLEQKVGPGHIGSALERINDLDEYSKGLRVHIEKEIVPLRSRIEALETPKGADETVNELKHRFDKLAIAVGLGSVAFKSGGLGKA